MSPYRDSYAPARLFKLPNENTYVRVEDVIAVEEQSGGVVILFRNGEELRWDTDSPADLARQIAEAINDAP